MGLWSSLFGREQRSPENPSTNLANPDSWLKGLWGADSDSGVKVTPEKALQIPTVWQCVTMLSDDFAKLPAYVYEYLEEGGRKVAEKHPAYPILRRKVNKYLTTGQFRRAIMFHTLTRGNGYAWITFNGRMEPSEMILLDPDRTEPVFMAGGLYYVTMIGDEKKVLADWEVFHLRGVGYDGIKGYSIIDHAINSMGLALAAEKYGNKHFSNGTRVGGVLQHPGRLTPEAAKNLQASFQQRYEGLDNAHKTLLLEEGAKFTPTTQTPNEAQFIQLREFQRKEIASWFKVPPSKLGDSDSVSYNSLEQSNQAYLDSAVDPWLVAFEEECFDKLLTETQKRTESHFIEVNRAALLRTDLETRYKAYEIGWRSGWYTINQIRAKENEAPIGKEGDEYFVPVNMQTIDRAINPPEPPKPLTPNNAPAVKKPKGGQTGKRTINVEEKFRPLVEAVVTRSARRLVEGGRKASAKVEWITPLAERLNDHVTVLIENLSPVLNALSVVGDGSARAEKIVSTLDRRLNQELGDIFVASDSKAVRLEKWDNWATRYLNDIVPETVDAIVKAYE